MRFSSVIAMGSLLLLSACGNAPEKAEAPKVTPSANAAPPLGKQLFTGNCMQCHALNQDRIGPSLAGVLGRWNNDTARLVEYIKNSQAFIAKEGENSYIGKLYNKWYKTPMPAFTLPESDIKEIIRYVDKGVE